MAGTQACPTQPFVFGWESIFNCVSFVCFVVNILLLSKATGRPDWPCRLGAVDFRRAGIELSGFIPTITGVDKCSERPPENTGLRCPVF